MIHFGLCWPENFSNCDPRSGFWSRHSRYELPRTLLTWWWKLYYNRTLTLPPVQQTKEQNSFNHLKNKRVTPFPNSSSGPEALLLSLERDYQHKVEMMPSMFDKGLSARQRAKGSFFIRTAAASSAPSEPTCKSIVRDPQQLVWLQVEDVMWRRSRDWPAVEQPAICEGSLCTTELSHAEDGSHLQLQLRGHSRYQVILSFTLMHRLVTKTFFTLWTVIIQDSDS